MIRTTTRALGAMLIAFLGLSTVHVSAADVILKEKAFGDTVDSIALNQAVGTNGARLFTDAAITALEAGTNDCRVDFHEFAATAPKNLADAMPTHVTAATSSNVTSGVTCAIAGVGAGKILNITIADNSDAAATQFVAKVHVGDDLLNQSPAAGTVPTAAQTGKVFAQKVLHNVVAKADADIVGTAAAPGVCGLVPGADPTVDDPVATMQIRIDSCDISDLFIEQVTAGVAIAYGFSTTQAQLMKVGVTNSYMLIDSAGSISDVSDVVATAIATPTGGTARATHESDTFDITGAAGLSSTAPSATAKTKLTLGQEMDLGYVSAWFVLRNQAEAGNEVRFTARSSTNINETLDVITRFTAVDLSDPLDGDTTDPGESVGVHATLEVDAIGTGNGSVTVTATQGTGPSAVTVSATQNFDVEATEVFKVLSFEMLDDWLENSNFITAEAVVADRRNGLELLNTAIEGNIKIETAGLDVEYSVSSEPAGLFALKMTTGDNPEVEVDPMTGAPEIVKRTATTVVPDAEMYDEIMITLTAKPAGSNADEENLSVTIGIADDEDDTEFTATCELELDGIFEHETAQHRVPKSALVAKGRGCVEGDQDDVITSVAGNATPACTMDADDNMTFPEGMNVCVVSSDETNFVIHTKAAETAGTNTAMITFPVTAGGSDKRRFNFTKEVVVLTGANTAPRFSGGASQVMVDAIKETRAANMNIGPAETGAWTASDVNATGDGLDEVTHALQGANAMGIAGGAHLGYCLSANAMTGAVSTATCGIGASAFSGLNFERLTTVVREATDELPEVRSFSVNLIASDKFGGTATLEIVIQVENIPEAPTRNATAAPATIALKQGDDPVTVDLDTYFDDPDGAQLMYSATSSTAGVASVTATADMGVITITPGTTSGSTTITGTVTGPLDADAGEVAPAPVTFMVTNFAQSDNTKPEYSNGITSVAYEISEDATGGTTVGTAWIDSVDNGAAGSAEAMYDKLSFEIEGYDAGESPFSVNAMGQIAVVARKLNYEDVELEVFYLKVVDSFGLSDSLRVSVSVLDANEAPYATEYGKSLEDTVNMVVVGGATTLNLRGAFNDPEATDAGQLLISTQLSNPSRLDVIIDEDDVAHLMGKAAGAVKVSLKASDGTHETTEDIHFDVTVVENSAPTVADAIADLPVYTGSVLDVALVGVFSDPNLAIGDAVMVTSAESSNTASVIATLNDDHSAVTLVGRAVGAATVTVCAADSAGASVCDEFDVHVMDEPPPNNAPEVANALAGVTVIEGETLDVDLSEVFSDADDDELTLTATSSDEAVASVGEVGEDGMLPITASMLGDSEAVASTDITVMADDGNGGTASDVFTVVVIEANNAPTVASAQPDVSIIEGESADVDLSGVFSDPDGDTLTLSAESADETVASVGEVGDDGMVTITVALLADDVESVSTSVTVTADDGRGGTVSDTFDVVVVQANRPPMVAMSLSGISVEEGGSQDVDVSEAFTDADGDELTLTASSSDADLVSVGEIGDDGMLTVTAGMLADGADSGSADVTVTADDGSDGTVSDTFTVIVLRGNEPPVVANALSGVTIVEGHTSDVDVSDVFSDPDGDDLTLSAMTSDGDVASISEIGDDGMLTVTAGMLADGAQSASADVTVKADDGHGGNARDTFTVVVIPDNEPPTVIASIGSVDIFQLMDLDVDLSGVFEDPDGDDLVLTAISADAGLASLGEIGEDQMLGITAGKLNRGQTETMTEVTVTASDGEFEVSDTFTVNILRNNIAPVVAMSVDSQLITRGTPITIDVSGVFTDEDAATDPNDDELSLTVMVGDTTIVGADLDNGMISLDLEGIAPGMTAVTLTATDLYGGMAETSFEAMVDTRPEAISSISPIALEIGGEGFELDLMTLFRDDDGDTLTYDISLSPSGIANYSMSGMTVNLMPASRGITTLMVTAADDRGYSVSLSGSISVGDEEIRKVAETALAAYARQMITSVDTAVGSRLLSGSQISDLQLASTTDSLTGTQTATASSEDANVMDVLDPNMWTTGNTQQQSQMSGKQGVLNALGLNRQSFAMKLNATEGAGAWSVWGTTDRQNFEGASYDGMASSVYLGVDLQATECFLVGASVARNSGEIDYSYGTAEQSMDTEQTTFLPYFRYDFAPQTSVWGVAGIGSGDVDSTVVGTSNQSSDLDSTLYMFGLRHGLSKMGAIDLALRGDVAMANIETASGDGAVDGLSADVNRIRAGLEGSYTVDMGDGGTFAPFGELSLRNDGGDGDTGTGVEVSGGFRVNLNSFNLEARGRTLASHGADDYEESGFSLTATLNPAADGSGLSFSLAPRWGGSALSSGAIWAEQGVLNQGLNGFSQGNALEARIGYGKRIMGERFMLTPFADFDAGDDVRQYLLGARLDQLINASSSLNVDMAVGRVERRSTGEAGAQVGLNATLRF